jgi:hypothetical protein
MTIMTKAGKHTEGPWEIGHELYEGFSVVREISPNCGHLLVIATSGMQSPYLGHEITPETALANAKLIAQAPAMAELLKAYKLALQGLTVFRVLIDSYEAEYGKTGQVQRAEDRINELGDLHKRTFEVLEAAGVL